MQEVRVLSLSGRSPEGNGNHSSILAWEIPWTEGPCGLYSPWGYKRAGHGLATKQQRQMQILFSMIVLVSSGCRNRISHIFISHSSGEEGSPRSGCWLIWSGVRDCFLNHRWLSSLSYGREKERERSEGELFWSLLIRSLISSWKLYSHDLMTSQRPHFQIPWRGGAASTYEFLEDTFSPQQQGT